MCLSELLEYSDDNGEVICERIYAHDGELWALSTCPTDRSLFGSVFEDREGKEGGMKAAVWKMGDLGEDVVTTLTVRRG